MPILRAGPFGSVNDITQRYFQDEPDDPTLEIVPINCANKTTSRWTWGLYAFADKTINEEGDTTVEVEEYQFGGAGTVESTGGDFGSFARIVFMYQATEDWNLNGTITEEDGSFYQLTQNGVVIDSGEILDEDLSTVTLPSSGAVPIRVSMSTTGLTLANLIIDYDIN
jgi:hypothetical protein